MQEIWEARMQGRQKEDTFLGGGAEVPTPARARAAAARRGIAAKRVITAPAATTPHGASVEVAAGAALRRLTRYTKFIYDIYIYMIRNNLKILETCTCALNII